MQRRAAAVTTGHTATVVASMINKLEVRRALGSGFPAFTEMREAEGWLDEGSD